jgi:hypothetical protein
MTREECAVLHVPDLAPRERVVAWRPQLPGVTEVLHARFVRHAYPAHTHDAWTLLRAGSEGGFVKRVVYLDSSCWTPTSLPGRPGRRISPTRGYRTG